VDCPACQHANAAGAERCAHCGVQLGVACARCGAALLASARFCHACGAPAAAAATVPAPGAAQPATPAAERAPRSYTPRHLAEKILRSRSALEGERKQVTVLFADVKGSVELSELVDAEEWHRLLDGFFQILAEGVHRYEGTINQYTGDGIMALFGAPIAHEDHAQRACYAALWLLDELRRYANALRVERGLDFSVRIGLNSGDVVVAAIGDDLRMDYTAQGHTVGLAGRMQQIAEPGHAYLTEHTARLVGGFFRLADLGHTTLKGSSVAVGVHELLGVGALRTRLDLSRSRGFSRFVGRVEESARLRAALDEATRGEGRVVGVVGEPGVGKSRLCFESAQAARAAGVAVYEAHCPRHGSTLRYLAILELLRALFDVGEDDGDHAARRKIAGELALLDGEFRDDLPLVLDWLGLADPAAPALAMDPSARLAKLGAFLRRLVRARSERAPLLLVLDDLHWIDPGSDALLAEIAAAVKDTRTLLLVNFRPEYAAPWTSAPHYRQVALAPLGPEATDELLRDLLGDDPSVAELGAWIRARTAGNPFFVEELVQSLVEEGRLAGERGRYRLAQPVESLSIPPTVQAVLAARIDRLPDAHKRALQAAAVVGKRFHAPVLARVLELAEAELAASLAALERAEFIRPSALHPEPEYAFRHPLTQEVAYASQLSEARAELHARVARALADAQPARHDELAPLLAQHWEAARRPLEAAAWHRRAADAIQTRDFSGAERHLRRVRELADREPDAKAARELALAARIGILFIGGRQGLAKEEAEQILAEGRRLVDGSGSPQQLALLLYAYGLSCIFSGDFEEALQILRDVEDAARGAGAEPMRLGARISTGHACWALGRLEEGLAIVDSVLAALDADPALERQFGGGTPGRTGVWSLRAALLTALGRLDEAERYATLSLESARAQRVFEWVGMGHAARAAIALHRGDADRATQEARRALEVGDRIGYLNARIDGLSELGAACMLREEWSEAIQHLEAALADTQRSGNVIGGPQISSYLSEAWLGVGDAARAVAHAKSAVTVSALRKSLHREAQAQIALARALLAERSRDAVALAETALKRAEALLAESGARALAPQLEIARAELGAASGDRSLVERASAEALRLLRALGAPARADALAARACERRP
jgi:class 3 adenylate cyclase